MADKYDKALNSPQDLINILKELEKRIEKLEKQLKDK